MLVLTLMVGLAASYSTRRAAGSTKARRPAQQRRARSKRRSEGAGAAVAKFGKSWVKGRMKLTIETEREDDGRWLAEVPELPGVLAYGATQGEAMLRAETLALRVIAEQFEQLEHGERKAVAHSA